MKTESTQTFDLSEADIRVAISEYIEKRFGKGESITVDLSTYAVTCGYGMNEYDEYKVKITATRKINNIGYPSAE